MNPYTNTAMASTDGAISSTEASRSALGCHRRGVMRGVATDCIWAGTVSCATGCPSKRAARQPVIGLPRRSLLHRLYLQTPASLHAACRVACVLGTSPLVTNSARASLYWVAQLSNDAAP